MAYQRGRLQRTALRVRRYARGVHLRGRSGNSDENDGFPALFRFAELEKRKMW